MLRRALPLAIVILAAGASAVAAQRQREPIDRSELDQLIALGRANRLSGLVRECAARKPSTSALVGFTGVAGAATQALSNSSNVFTVRLMNARGRVASQARAAAVDKVALSPSDVSDDALNPGLDIAVEPRLPDTSGTGSAEISAKIVGIKLIAKREAGDSVLEPDTVRAIDRTWTNAAAASVDYQAMTATFTGRQLQSVPSTVPIIILVETEVGARTCELSARDFDRVLTATK